PEAAVRLPDERVAARTEREGENDFVLSEAVSVAAVREERRDRRGRWGEERGRPWTGPVGEAEIGREGQYHERRREDAERDDARRSGEPQRHDHRRDERREERKTNGHQVFERRTCGEVDPGQRDHAAPIESQPRAERRNDTKNECDEQESAAPCSPPSSGEENDDDESRDAD